MIDDIIFWYKKISLGNLDSLAPKKIERSSEAEGELSTKT